MSSTVKMAIPAREMTAAVRVAAAGKVTTTVTTTVASSVTTAAVSATCLGRHISCGHHQTGGAGCREAIHPGQGPEGQ